MPRPIYIIVNLRTSILPPLKIIATIHLFLPSFSFIIFPHPFFRRCLLNGRGDVDRGEYDFDEFLSAAEWKREDDYYRFVCVQGARAPIERITAEPCVKLGRDESDADGFNSTRRDVSLQK